MPSNRRKKYIRELWHWQAAFEALDIKIRKKAVVLPIHALATQLILEALLVENECAVDKFLPEFKTLLWMTRTFVRDHRAQLQSEPVGYSIELGVLPAMYVVVQSDITTRREIIKLLRDYPRRENIWDSNLVAEIGTCIADLEEEGADGDFVPEFAKIRITRIRVDTTKRNAKVQCMKRNNERRLTFMERTIDW